MTWPTQTMQRLLLIAALMYGLPAMAQLSTPQTTEDQADTTENTTVSHDVQDGAVFADLPDSLADLDIAALMEIEVVSVSGTLDAWFTTPAAITVITPQDIERGGFQLLPEALRMVPGLNVGRVTANKWAVGVRGFNGLFANKLQVSFDGRSAYNLEFGGVNWDEVDMILQDLEQIEVIRGPGATLWGTNAVNGVINIRSKNAKDTQGWLVTGGTGSELRTIGQVRYGGQLAQDSYFRVWTKYINHDGSVDASGSSRPDDYDSLRGGFRADGTSDEGSWTLQSDFFHSNRIGGATSVPQPTGHLDTLLVTGDIEAFTGNVLGRVRAEWGENDWAELQGYYEARRRTTISGLVVKSHTVNTEFRRHLQSGSHNVLFGAGFRFDAMDSRNITTLGFTPSRRDLHQFRGFIQDTIKLADDQWLLMVGSKFEYNDFTGFELQPSARLSWAPDESTMLWGSVSRPIRAPSRAEQDVDLIMAYVDTGLAAGGAASGTIVPNTLTHNPASDSESLWAFELGYRKQLDEGLLVDVTSFYNNYQDVLSIPAGVISPVWTNDSGTIHTWGGEVSLNWDPSEQLSVVASYSYFSFDFNRSAEFLTNPASTQPSHMAQLRTSYDLTDDLNVNLNTYYVDNSGQINGSAYIRLDAGLTWQIDNNTKLTVWLQNMLDDAHIEAEDTFLNDGPTETQRGVVITLTKEF